MIFHLPTLKIKRLCRILTKVFSIIIIVLSIQSNVYAHTGSDIRNFFLNGFITEKVVIDNTEEIDRLKIELEEIETNNSLVQQNKVIKEIAINSQQKALKEIEEKIEANNLKIEEIQEQINNSISYIEYQELVSAGAQIDILKRANADLVEEINKLLTGVSYSSLDSINYKDTEYIKNSIDKLEQEQATVEVYNKYVGNFIFPLPDTDRYVTSEFGYRVHPITGIAKNHNGSDYRAPIGTNLVAIADGTIITAGYTSANGNYVRINHGYGVVITYLHMSEISVKDGQSVVTGQSVGKTGNTGLSTGPHLHAELSIDGNKYDFDILYGG